FRVGTTSRQDRRTFEQKALFVPMPWPILLEDLQVQWPDQEYLSPKNDNPIKILVHVGLHERAAADMVIAVADRLLAKFLDLKLQLIFFGERTACAHQVPGYTHSDTADVVEEDEGGANIVNMNANVTRSQDDALESQSMPLEEVCLHTRIP